MSEDAPQPSGVTAAVTPVPLPENFTTAGAAALARDIALEMYDLPVILKKYGISDGQYATLNASEYFRDLVKQMAADWHAPRSVQQRLALQTAVGLEEVLPDIIARAKVRNERLADVAQLVKVLADICGANAAKTTQNAPTEKFSITINLGADTEVYNATRPASVTIESTPVTEDNTFAPVPSGLQSLLAIQTEPETP